eukprot:gene33802-43680_t
MVDPNPELPYAHCDDDLSVHTNTQICTCELQSGSSASIVPYFGSNLSYCPAYPKLTLDIDYDTTKADGSVKCSFGHRPYNSAANNCYGKLYAMNFAEASSKCSARGGHLAKVDTIAELTALYDLFVNDYELSVGLSYIGERGWRWNGYEDVPVNMSSFNGNSTVPFKFHKNWEWSYGDCVKLDFNKLGWGSGDLLADEGGFCIWYYDDPVISLPDDQSGNFRNTELAYFLLSDPNLMTKNSNYSFHCHFSPTNFGVARIYSQQHMLERLYTGSAHQHCFCGYKYLGNLVDRCDCTRS